MKMERGSGSSSDMKKQITSISDSLKGYEREQNKDGSLVLEHETYFLAIIFDGVSSANRAKEGVTLAKEFIKKVHDNYTQDGTLRLADLVCATNDVLVASGIPTPYATISSICIPFHGKNATIVSLGDSRIYGITGQEMTQLTKDDNPPDDENVITKCLGMEELERIQVREKNIELEAKRLLLCTDGFYHVMEDRPELFHEVLNYQRLGNIKKRLRKELSGDNYDDASYVIVDW